MASHRRPKQPGRARISVLTAAAASAVAISAQAGAAQAAPRPTKESVKAQVDKLNEQTEAAIEKYDGAKEQQQKLRAQVNNLQDEVARQQAHVSDMEGTLAQVAASQYRSGGIDPTVQLMLSSDPSQFLDKASSLDQLSGQQTQVLKQLQAQQRRLDQSKAEAEGKLAELEQTTRQLKATKSEVQEKLAKAQTLLNTLTAQERAALQASEAAASQRASRAATRTTLTPASTAGVSGTAAAALSAAKTRLGMPYGWGDTGPGSFDCSGLTQWAYAQAGVSLPRTSESQATAGTRLTRAQLQPGDLVFFFSDLHHVGIYAGNGMVLHAPKTGDVVKYESMDDGYLPFQFGVRI